MKLLALGQVLALFAGAAVLARSSLVWLARAWQFLLAAYVLTVELYMEGVLR